MSLKILEELTFIDSDKIQRLNGAIESNFREKNKKHAAANIRSLAKILYMKGQYVYSLEQFERAAVLNNECELFHRELQDRLYCVEY